jgi:AcrR family transcriptional regulator
MIEDPVSVTDIEEKTIRAALDLAAVKPWRQIGLGAIAAAVPIDLAELYALFPTKAAILTVLHRRVDLQMLDDPTDPTEPARDRLFEVLMHRFEALQPYRLGLRGLARHPDPDLLPLLPLLPRSLGWVLEAAGVRTDGIAGIVRVKLLGLVWLSVFRRFLDDDGPDLAATMAALDRALDRAEPWLRLPPSSPVEEPAAAAGLAG